MSPTDNIFLQIARKEIPAQVVYEDDKVVAFKDINPQAPVHVLIVPREIVIESVNELKPEHKELLGHMFLVAQKLARDLGVSESGYRCVINSGVGAGQSVFHLHLHLLGGRIFGWPPG